MPTTYTAPGVYIEEIPSSNRSTVRVSTSTTAFIGRALRGPVNQAVNINSFREFQRIFGGLWAESYLGYSVRDFYDNGGRDAFIVRVFKEPDAENSPPSKSQITIGDLNFEAANPGSWGENLCVTVDLNVTQKVSDANKLDIDKMFNLTVHETIDRYNKKAVIKSESFANLTLEDHQNRVDRVLESQSALLRYKTGDELPSDLSSVKALANNGIVTYSVKESMDSKKKEMDELSDDKKDEKKALEKQLNALKSSDGESLDANEFIGTGKEDSHEGLYALEDIHTDEMYNLMCIPPYNVEDVDPEVINKAAEYCEKKRAFLIVDPPSFWKNKDDAINGLSKIGTNSANAALYFPRVIAPDPLYDYRPKELAPSGAIAGVIARTDANIGIWKAPAGVEAVLQGVDLSIRLTDDDNGELNPIGINCLRTFPVYGNVVWGARTLQGNDQLQSEWKYLNVKRLALYIEESIIRSIKWAVFEPNNETLWAELRVQIGSFLSELFADGAFQGGSPSEAFFVKVDSTTTTQSEIDQGLVNIVVGIAPVKPAEFIVLTFQQQAGQVGK